MSSKKIPDHDKSLWDAYIKDVSPLPKDKKRHHEEKKYYPPRPKKPYDSHRILQNEQFQEMLFKSATVDRQHFKIKSKHLETMRIDGKIDLHGMSEEQAYEALTHFLRRLQNQSLKWALVVTGKSGILFEMVPKWLGVMSDLVLDYSYAKQAYGGSGALYVHIKNLKRR